MKKIMTFLLFFVASIASAQNNLPFIVHTGPGSASDVIARTIGKELEKNINSTVVMQNAPGAEGLVALSRLAEQRHAALFSSGSSLHVFSHVVNNTDVSDLKLLGTVATGATLWYTHPNSKIKNAKDLVDAFKQNRSIRIGSDTLSGRINSIALKDHYRATEIIDVPYKTSAQVAVDVAAGNLEVGLNVLNPGIRALIDSGKLIPLAVTTPASTKINDIVVPSLTQYTPAPQFVAAWIISTSYSRPVSREIQLAFDSAIKSPEVAKVVTNLGLDHNVKNAKETEQFVKNYIDSVKKLQTRGIELK
jgi:tripartite-type tricarboxylate transporter receptor subunit TctC